MVSLSRTKTWLKGLNYDFQAFGAIAEPTDDGKRRVLVPSGLSQRKWRAGRLARGGELRGPRSPDMQKKTRTADRRRTTNRRTKTGGGGDTRGETESKDTF